MPGARRWAQGGEKNGSRATLLTVRAGGTHFSHNLWAVLKLWGCLCVSPRGPCFLTKSPSFYVVIFQLACWKRGDNAGRINWGKGKELLGIRGERRTRAVGFHRNDVPVTRLPVLASAWLSPTSHLSIGDCILSLLNPFFTQKTSELYLCSKIVTQTQKKKNFIPYHVIINGIIQFHIQIVVNIQKYFCTLILYPETLL